MPSLSRDFCAEANVSASPKSRETGICKCYVLLKFGKCYSRPPLIVRVYAVVRRCVERVMSNNDLKLTLNMESLSDIGIKNGYVCPFFYCSLNEDLFSMALFQSSHIEELSPNSYLYFAFDGSVSPKDIELGSLLQEIK